MTDSELQPQTQCNVLCLHSYVNIFVFFFFMLVIYLRCFGNLLQEPQALWFFWHFQVNFSLKSQLKRHESSFQGEVVLERRRKALQWQQSAGKEEEGRC